MKSQSLRGGLDVILGAMPLVIMAALAGWSYWLVRATPASRPEQSHAAQVQLPDLRLGAFELNSYDAQGKLASRVTGSQGTHHPADDSMEVNDASLWSTRGSAADSRDIMASADLLWVNGPQTQYRLTGRARVEQSPGQADAFPMVLRGEELFLDDAKGQINSARPVVMTQGARRLEGDRMHYERSTDLLEMHGQVRLVQAPANP